MCSYFGAPPKIKSDTVSTVSPSILSSNSFISLKELLLAFLIKSSSSVNSLSFYLWKYFSFIFEGHCCWVWYYCFFFFFGFVFQSLTCVWLWPCGLQDTRVLCLPVSPRVCSNSCLLSWWCYLTIPSFCLYSFPASGYFPMSRLFASGRQSIGASATVLQWIFRVDFL